MMTNQIQENRLKSAGRKEKTNENNREPSAVIQWVFYFSISRVCADKCNVHQNTRTHIPCVWFFLSMYMQCFRVLIIAQLEANRFFFSFPLFFFHPPRPHPPPALSLSLSFLFQFCTLFCFGFKMIWYSLIRFIRCVCSVHRINMYAFTFHESSIIFVV